MMRRMRKLNSQSGQALIMAVLVMLIVAVLAALFLAVIVSQLRQAQRQSFSVALQEIATAGLNYAHYNMLEGPEGADWRPDPNPGTFDYGDGEFRLTVTYEPQAGDPYSRYIKLESVAALKGNPFLQRRMVGYQPILITDFIRFVANGEKNPLPASLGASVRMYLYDAPPAPWPGRLYKTVIDGPIRVNSDLAWHGDVQVNLSSNRGDNIAVAGDISHDMVPRWNETTQLWDGPSSQVLVAIDGGAPRSVLPSQSAAFDTLGGFYRDGRQQPDINSDPRWVRYLDAPALDAARYLALTRDSGTWIDGAGPYAGRQVNTGWCGYGKGLYINNPEHIKHNHDYEQMRSEWMDPGFGGSPDAVVLELLPGAPGGSPPPRIRLTWRGAGAGFRNRRGELIGAGPLDLPFPENGVIYAAGDVAVKGMLPPRVGSPARYYDQESYAFPNDPLGQSWTPVDDTNRHYHLTVVSGGNVFIEGNVLGPEAAGLPGASAATDTKLALLARDSVVFNTPALQQVLQPATQVVVEDTPWYEVRPGQPLDVVVTTASMDPVQIYLKHSGQPNVYLPVGRAGAAKMQVLINGVPYSWEIGGLPVYDGATNYFLFVPPPIESYNNETNAVYPVQESIPNVSFGANKRITFTPLAIGEPHIVRFRVTDDSQRFYWVRDIRARVDVEIDAAIYAEHGSWFVIPGSFFNPPPPDPGSDPMGSPAPGEPLDIRITVLGAVAENRTAPLADAMDWVAKWRGANAGWLPTSANYDPDLGISRYTLRYLYDESLCRGLIANEPGGPPRLPKLPVSPAMIAWGERI